MRKLLCGLFFIVTAYGKTCRTPVNTDGSCISLYECGSLFELVKGRTLNPAQRQFLLASHCVGGIGRYPHICCPNKAINLNAPIPVPTPTKKTSIRISNPADDINFLLPDPTKYDCGVSIGMRIYGGQDTDIDEFPWLALLEYKNDKGHRQFSCGGTLINDRYILTAAHCIVGEIQQRIGNVYSIRFGEYDMDTAVDCVQMHNTNSCNDPPQDILIDELIPHPNYNPNSPQNHHDIALIRLARKVVFSDFVQPICLPSSTFRSSKTEDTDWVAGFGRTLTASNSKIKQKLAVKIFDHQRCEQKFGAKGVQITDNQICAGGYFEKDTCQGDSGGPLMKLSQVWTLEGIVSYGNKCGLEGWPGIYTKTSAYMDWIKMNLRQ